MFLLSSTISYGSQTQLIFVHVYLIYIAVRNLKIIILKILFSYEIQILLINRSTNKILIICCLHSTSGQSFVDILLEDKF